MYLRRCGTTTYRRAECCRLLTGQEADTPQSVPLQPRASRYCEPLAKWWAGMSRVASAMRRAVRCIVSAVCQAVWCCGVLVGFVVLCSWPPAAATTAVLQSSRSRPQSHHPPQHRLPPRLPRVCQRRLRWLRRLLRPQRRPWLRRLLRPQRRPWLRRLLRPQRRPWLRRLLRPRRPPPWAS